MCELLILPLAFNKRQPHILQRMYFTPIPPKKTINKYFGDLIVFLVLITKLRNITCYIMLAENCLYALRNITSGSKTR